ARKMLLPNYGVFDEQRYFQMGERPLVLDFGGFRLGVSICEDIWHPEGPIKDQVLGGGAEAIINISSSPFHAGKTLARSRMLATRSQDYSVIVAFCNLVGGQDELVFDGNSAVYDFRGELMAKAPAFEESLLLCDLDFSEVFRYRLHDPRFRQARRMYQFESQVGLDVVELALPDRGDVPGVEAASAPFLDPLEEIYRALVVGTRDYLHKNGFRKAVVGLSGGVDSALTAVIAADALGSNNVAAVFMPSRYTSRESFEDAERLSKNLGLKLIVLGIDGIFDSYLKELAGVFKRRKPDETEENIQARIRGNLLMALSNKFGWLVLSTGNKSEGAMGYCTLYGDLAGGFSVIKDVPKTMVYKLARWRNSVAKREIIPERILTKPPSAELKPNQKDTDSLPPYDLLDPILRAYVEEDRSLDEIVEMGFEPDVVERVAHTVDASEYKRRQVPPGVKITPRAFGKDWRLPITNRFRERVRSKGSG
ncbi:MAG TPA: NAD+ synthase, partial [Proteobacteria bacterium]|nr:NAD+ synthase [Pseudomonadota bacterium]